MTLKNNVISELKRIYDIVSYPSQKPLSGIVAVDFRYDYD